MSDEETKPDINAVPDLALGVYSNVFLVSCNTFDVIFDFAVQVPGVTGAKLKSRVMVSPQHAKAIMQHLQEVIAKYEQNVGPIALGQGGPTTIYEVKN